MENMPSIKVYDAETKQEVSVTIEMQQKAVQSHNTIMSSANVIVNAVYDMAIALKDMRDNKLYLAFGCKSFKQYCDERLEISRAQAYNYINVLEYFGEDGLKEVGHYGIKKLKQIQKASKADEQTKEQLLEHTTRIIETARGFVEYMLKTANELGVEGTEEEMIKRVIAYMKVGAEKTGQELDGFLVDEEIALVMLNASKKNPHEVMENVKLH